MKTFKETIARVGTRIIPVLGAALLLAPAAFGATLDELATQIQAISRDVASISATTTPAARTQILASASTRLAAISAELVVLKREEVLNRISRELASTTAEVASITATTSASVKTDILTRASAKLAGFVTELRALQGTGITYLRLGDRGTGVSALQTVLKTDASLYPSGLVTGYFGPLTEAAVKAFQTRHNLAVTGTVDASTFAKMVEVYGTAANAIQTNNPLPLPGGSTSEGKG
jgi:murein L,D-transpeptidase YcbB/YkuD